MLTNLVAGSNFYRNFFHTQNEEIEICINEHIRSAEEFFNLLETGNYLVSINGLNQDWQDNIRSDQGTGKKINYKEALGFCDEAWPEAKVLLTWIFLHISIFGGKFCINNQGLSLEQKIGRDFIVYIHMSSKNELGSLVYSYDWWAVKGHSSVLAQIGNRLLELKGEELDDHSDSLGAYKLENYNTQDQTFWGRENLKPEDLRIFEIAPWTRLNMDQYIDC